MAAKRIQRDFILTDGTVKLNLVWRSGKALPDFDAVPIVAARMEEGEFRWATGETCCPKCQHLFSIEAAASTQGTHVANEIGHKLLTPEAVPVLMMVGNVKMDADVVDAVCPACGEVFAVSENAGATEMHAIIEAGCITIKRPRGRTVCFNTDGTVFASELHLFGMQAPDAVEFASVPRFVGVSREAKDWLRLALGIRADERLGGDSIDLLDFALRHRFKGYGEGFISEARTWLVQQGTRLEAVDSLFSLPRHCADHETMLKLFGQSGLPDKPSVRKAAATRPAALALAAKLQLGMLCGDDPNLAVALLKSPRLDAAWGSALLGRRGTMSGLLRLAAKEEKPSYLVNRLLEVDCDSMKDCVAYYEELCLAPYQALVAYRLARKDYGFAGIIAKPELLAAYAEIARTSKSLGIRYGEGPALQGEYNGFRFSLPRQTGRFVSAGAALKNCLGSEGYAESVMLGRTLVFLVSKGASLKAAVEVHPQSKSVIQMYAKANRKIEPTEDLGIAVALWAADKGIDLSECEG